MIEVAEMSLLVQVDLLGQQGILAELSQFCGVLFVIDKCVIFNV